MIESASHTAVARPIAPVRFLFGRIENLKTLRNEVSFYLIKSRRVFLRYRVLTAALLFSQHPLSPLFYVMKRPHSRLMRILKFAKAHIPFYQKSLKTLDLDLLRKNKLRLEELPTLSKDAIRRHFPDRMLRNQRKKISGHLLARTSGSTAESVQHVRPPNAEARTLINSVIHYSRGLLVDPVFVLSTPHCSGMNCSLKSDLTSQSIPFFSRNPFFRHLGDLIPLGNKKNILEAEPAYFQSIQNTLKKFKSSILVGDPVYLSAFAWFLLENDFSPPAIRFILTSYELLTPTAAQLLSLVFKCPIHSQYGGSEVLGVARTCTHGFFHENEQHVLVEIIHQGRPALPGEIGDVLLTDLCNTNMPFIRYEIGDVAERLPGTCPCGSPAKRLGIIHGRKRDLFYSTHENHPQLLSPLAIDKIFEGFLGVKFYRVIKKGTTNFEISYIPSRFFRNSDLVSLSQRAKEILGERASIQFRAKEFFRPETSMKYRFSFSEVEDL